MNSRTAAMPPEEGIGATRISLRLLWGTGWDLLRSGVFRSQELGEVLKNRYGRYLTDEITRTHQVRMTPRLLWFIDSLKAWGLVWKWIPIQNIIGLVMGSLSRVTREQWTVPRHSDPIRSFFCCKLFKETTNLSSDKRPHRTSDTHMHTCVER